ncbi:MAG: hypothetical protein U7123_17420 [Potamolinea sp.]
MAIGEKEDNRDDQVLSPLYNRLGKLLLGDNFIGLDPQRLRNPVQLTDRKFSQVELTAKELIHHQLTAVMVVTSPLPQTAIALATSSSTTYSKSVYSIYPISIVATPVKINQHLALMVVLSSMFPTNVEKQMSSYTTDKPKGHNS